MINARASIGNPPILVLSVGDFGHAVAIQLKILLPDVTILADIAQGEIDTLLQNISSIAVFVAWRPIPIISELLDARSFRTRTPFISLTLSDGAMFLGPIVIPGSGACWRCWASRDLQSGRSPNIFQQRIKHYSDHPDEGPQGYLPSLAWLGAAQLANVVKSIQHSAANAGEVHRTDCYTRQIATEKTMGFDNCDRCGLRRPLSSRSHTDLRAGLMSLWQQS